MKTSSLSVLLVLAIQPLLADGPRENTPEAVRPITPLGIEIPAEERQELEKRAAELLTEITDLRSKLKKSPRQLELLPDVEVCH